MRRQWMCCAIVIGSLLLGCGTSRELLLAGRVYEFPDRKPIPEPPAHEPNPYFDFIDNSIFEQVEAWFDIPRHVRWLAGTPKQAVNIDAFDEVGNSSWFTNRALTLTQEEALRGPDTVDGPDQSRPWRVAGVKTQGITPGFRIKDARGDMYLLKFDPINHPELATGAEVISTKLVWACGYNTPENYLVFFTEEQLSIEGEVKLVDEFGNERVLTPGDVSKILKRVPRTHDGRIRAIASKFLSGIPIGPLWYISHRRTDPNDVYRHEHRRELRGLQPLAAWINHNDVRRINSLDVYTKEGYVKHHLIDFGSTLGSASWGPNYPSEGFEYILDFKTMAKSTMALGAYKRPWRRHDHDSGIPSVGYFGADGFDPRTWKPNYPNMAFQRMTDRDGFWGARLVMSLSDEKIRGIVEQAQFSDPRATAYMIDTLIRRREAIGRHWYSRVNPLDRFAIEAMPDSGQVITFVDLAVDAGFEQAEGTSYRYRLMHNNFGGRDDVLDDMGGSTSISHQTTGRMTTITLPEDLLSEVYEWCLRNGVDSSKQLFYLKIYTRRALKSKRPTWLKLHLIYHGQVQGFTLAGIERNE